MKIIGHNIIHFDRLPSTNAYATELLSKNKPSEGTVITTDNQYAGRGQMQNTWESEPKKNVSLSVVLYPSFLEVKEQFYLSQSVSLAVKDTIDHFLPNFEVYVKWPNDIYIQDRKVAGILIQNQIQGKHISSSVVGLGINVNQQRFFSDAPNPCSIIHFLDKAIDLWEFRETLFEKLDARYAALRLKPFSALSEQYTKALYSINQPSCFEVRGVRVTGTIKGVSAEGQLLVQIEDELRRFSFKEIQFCRTTP